MGCTIVNLYFDPVKKANAAPDDPPSPLMALATPEDLRRLWDAFFAAYPVREYRPAYTAKFQTALDAEEAKRAMLN